jgi:hypothetical protein
LIRFGGDASADSSSTRTASNLHGCHQPANGADLMSKGMDRKKETKKKPSRTKEEKKAAKKSKK